MHVCRKEGAAHDHFEASSPGGGIERTHGGIDQLKIKNYVPIMEIGKLKKIDCAGHLQKQIES